MRFRGRELSHQELGAKVLQRIRDDLDETVKIEQFPKLEKQMVQILHLIYLKNDFLWTKLTIFFKEDGSIKF